MSLIPAWVGVIGSVTDRILSLPAWLVIGLVFALPVLEASAFVGFVFPGEIAVILGGVVASQGRVPLWAIIGDSVGYVIGRRWRTYLLHGTLGRLPIIRRDLDKYLDSARAYVRRPKGRAVFFGRFTVALRVLVPGLAGMSDVHYPSSLAYNVAGGVLWGTGFSILAYVAGANYKYVERIAGRAGLVLLALVVVGLVGSRLLRGVGERSSRLRSLGERLSATAPLAWVRGAVPPTGAVGAQPPRHRQPSWVLADVHRCTWCARRLDVHGPHPRCHRP